MSSYQEAYQQLNPEQRQAVDTIHGPVMVVAGPGSGKTQLLSLRVANILENEDILPENIICLTFTEAAAYNMRQRLASFIGNDAYKVHIHTFHSFGQSLLKDYSEYTGGAEKTAIDSVYQAEIIGSFVDTLPYNHILIPRGLDRSKLIKNIVQGITYLKQAGLTVGEYNNILAYNEQEYIQIIPIIREINSIPLKGKKDRLEVLDKIRTLADSIPIHDNKGYFSSYAKSLKASLLLAIEETESLEKATYTPISKWKTTHLIKGKDGDKTLIDAERIFKQKALADFYQQYQDYLNENQLLDFSDMLLNALSLLKENEALKDKLQSDYQFILVDEFQDTNEVQMQLILALTGDYPEPNILVVGDDDQAVYGFQGSDVSHMLSFQAQFPTAHLVVLTQNYRSRQAILDIARNVIIQGKDRLENKIEALEKRLESAKLRQDGDLAYYEFNSQIEEYTWIAQTIEMLRRQQVDLSEIAIIGRQHKHLEAIVPFLSQYDIPIDYEKQYNLLQETIIHQLIVLLQFIYSLTPSQSPRNDLLLEILSYSFWKIDTMTIWKFFQERPYKQSYIEKLYASQDKKLQEIAQFLLDLAIVSEYETIEVILLRIMGVEKDRSSSNSPFYHHYFGPHVFKEHQNEYIENLAKIDSFIEHIISYKKNKRVLLSDGLDTIKAYQNQGGMMVHLPINTGKQTVKLMTAHKVKGLEFETVFVIGAHTQGWTSKGASFPYPFPLNLPIVPAKDSEDDFLRLLFVALTRSKNNLFITTHLYDEKGKERQSLPYLTFLPINQGPQINETDTINSMWSVIAPHSFDSQEISFLEGVVQNYRLSASHINTFVDMVYGGPLVVLNSVLLRFPSLATPASIYGNILHKVFHDISLEVHSHSSIPNTDTLIDLAIHYLHQERLGFDDNTFLLHKIKEQLPLLIAAKKESFFIPHKSEYDVRNLFLEWEGVPLTGSIDRIEEYDNHYVIVDFKTGSPILSWDNLVKKEKLDAYKRQLWFYALLLKVAGQYQDKPLQGRIDFLEPTIEGDYISLDLDIQDIDIDYISNLVQIIYHKILNLDFPDITSYQKNKKGSAEFIQDLLTHKV